MREKNNETLLEKAANKLELPGEVLAGFPRITLTGNRKLHIDNHNGILEYSENLICVNCGKMMLKISGDRLDLVSINGDELLIKGFISNIEFV